jgi:hypothetical protein
VKADGSACHLLSRWFLARLTLRPCKWRRHVPPKRRLTYNGLHGVISQKMELFITIVVEFYCKKIGAIFINYSICYTYMCFIGSRDSAVGMATGYGLDDRGVGVRVPVGSRIFSSLYRPDRFWCPPSLLCNGYRGLFPWG